MATSLEKAFEEDVRPFIDIIDELRSLGLDKDVPLPAVVVVGDQSAGKSSVLEAISGVELPRGTDIVTRCPLELRLKKIHKNKVDELINDEDESEDTLAPWKGVISYTIEGSNELVKKYIENPSLVGAAVENATEKLTEGSKGISDSLIHLEVQSTTVPDLTLIDLPGIARVAVEGQSADVPEMTKTLIKKYVKKKETIILAVVPCNVDIATTEALQLAQQVDPEGKRTLGVLTKPDLMDHGTEGEICKIVNGEKVKLQLGYTVVKCRGQKAVEAKVSLKDAIESEEIFFMNHEIFGTLYQEKNTGIQNLSHQLTKQLVEQIKANMPNLKIDIEKSLSRTNKELERYGEGLPEEDHERQNFLINLLMKLGDIFRRLARSEHMDDDTFNNLRLFALVKDSFKELANAITALRPRRTNPKLKEEISKEIMKRKGKELPTFLSYPVFEGIVRQQIKRNDAPAKICLAKVNAIVEKITLIIIDAILGRFEPLKMEVNKLMNQERMKAAKNAADALQSIFAMENLVFTQDANFSRLMRTREVEDAPKLLPATKASSSGFAFGSNAPQASVEILGRHTDWFREPEQLDVDHMIRCLDVYCEVAATRMVDTIPMAIYHHLVKKLLEGMATEMIKISTQPDSHNTLLKEDSSTVNKRKKLLEKQQRLEKATIRLLKFGSSTRPTNGFQSGDDIEDENF